MANKLLLNDGFRKANSDNLPTVDIQTLKRYIRKNDDYIGPEIANVNSQRAERESYGECAIGWVQVKRVINVFKLIAAICPEHKCTSTSYTVTAEVDVEKEEITSAQCRSCIASNGGCKHCIAFVGWLHRRSEEPTRTEVTCYWKKSLLSRVGTLDKFVGAINISCGKRKRNASLLKIREKESPQGSFLKEVLDYIEMKRQKSNPPSFLPQLYMHFTEESHWFQVLDIHFLFLSFQEKKRRGSSNDFLEFCKTSITEAHCATARKMTKDQSKSGYWHRLRYARVTASKLHEVSRCTTESGTLVEQMFGAKLRSTAAMIRGTQLEKKVLDRVAHLKKTKFEESGFFISPNHPFFGASPDGINDTFVVEIKCPKTQRTRLSYIGVSGNISQKCQAQMQLQMFLSNRNSALFCVADPEFESNQKVEILEVKLDEEYVETLMCNASEYWCKAVWPKL